MKRVVNRIGHGIVLFFKSLLSLFFEPKIFLLFAFMLILTGLLDVIISRWLFGPPQLQHGVLQAIFLFLTILLKHFFLIAIVMAVNDFFRFNNFGLRSVLSKSVGKMSDVIQFSLVFTCVSKMTALSAQVCPILEPILASSWDVATFFLLMVLALEERPIFVAFARSLSLLNQKFWEVALLLVSQIVLHFLTFVYSLSQSTMKHWLRGYSTAALMSGGIVVTLVVAFGMASLGGVTMFKTRVYLDQ
jgi:hypothetical protein